LLKMKLSLHAICLTLVLGIPLTLSGADKPTAELLFEKHCGTCHDQAPNPRLPTREALQQKTRVALTRTLTTGMMRQQGSTLSNSELRTLVNWLGREEAAVRPLGQLTNHCEASPALASTSSMVSWSGWGNGPANTRFQQTGPGGLNRDGVPSLKLKWAFGFADDTTVRSQPTIYGANVFVGTQSGIVYSLDSQTGCVHWALDSVAAIRTSVNVAAVNQKLLAFFGDGSGTVYGVDANTGKPIWKHRVDDHPSAVVSGTPVVYRDILYVPAASYEEGAATAPEYTCCTFRGSISALNALTGAVIWKTYTIDQPAKVGPPTKRGAKTAGPSGAGIWTAPTLDLEKKVLYVSTGNNYSTPTTNTSDAVMALGMDTGKILWTKQFTQNDAYNVTCRIPDKVNCPDNNGEDQDFAAPPLLTTLKTGRRALILGQKSGFVYVVDPDKEGDIIWQAQVGRGHTMSGIQGSPATDGSLVYVGLSDLIYERHRKANSNRLVMTLDPLSGGGMFGYGLENGERLWQTPPPGCGDRHPCSPAQNSAVSVIPGVAFSGSVDGHLRAYDTGNGKIIWDYDTAHEYKTVNGIPAKGGLLDVSGAAVAGNLLVTVSGYGDLGGMPGNVLLAFSK
jgi:polyvinyl alcohol dehydrogenase (cytochrome)